MEEKRPRYQKLIRDVTCFLQHLFARDATRFPIIENGTKRNYARAVELETQEASTIRRERERENDE